jgi:hypothetical protein
MNARDQDQDQAGGALDALQQLEATIEQRDDSREVAARQLSRAQAEAERILAAAHDAGAQAGSRRRAELVARTQDECAAIRAAGLAEAEQIAARISAERPRIVAVLTGLVLGEEAQSDAGPDDEGTDRWPSG